MKATPQIRPYLLALGALCLLAGPALSQSAEGFDTSDLGTPADLPAAEPAAAGTPHAPAAPAPAAAAPAAAKPEAPAAPAGPSRYAGTGPELAAYVDSFVKMTSIRTRTTDPFGRYQDPEFKAPEPKIINSNKKAIPRAAPPVPFSDVVASIQVNMVIPSQKRFLVSTPAGARSLKQGNVFPIQLPNGKRVRVQVKSVTATEIRFVNLDTGEDGVVKPDVMPAGMQRGTAGITAPGMQPSGADAPLEIQTNVPPISSN
ncbi:hypothetical protein [Luteolibacter luteus]|uniref:Uncharacterized protein n=1 Tax=Luteolibacter luteus TaxID=2728835 RepID=A0A858RFD3_9BACT|nr:hypothetical protein [Luteolibacter luteus]QJE95557.1 hypothetical protein HHL09_07080 [Luteolibacter luteus]